MTAFRLERLLRLREDQAEAARQRWALAQRGVAEAQQGLDAARRRLADAREDLAASLGGRRAGPAVGQLLGAHRSLDSLAAAIQARAEDLEARRASAAELRVAYEVARRAVEALARLELRWRKAERARARRRDERTRDEFIASRAARARLAPRADRVPAGEPADGQVSPDGATTDR